MMREITGLVTISD